MRIRRHRLLTSAAPAAALVAGLIVMVDGTAGASERAGSSAVIYVAHRGATGPSGCRHATHHTIRSGVYAAAPGDTVKVCAGTYDPHKYGTFASITPVPGVTITTAALVTSDIKLIGMPGAVINAEGLVNGVTLLGPGAAGATVKGFTTENAIGEGILSAATSGVTIWGNTVIHNDLGTASSPWPFCAANGEVPGDCGEGLGLLSTSRSTVGDNTIEFNSGGILMSDELGPTAYNTVEGNLVEDNESDCGITVVGHNPAAVKNGKPQPSVAGVYDNLIKANSVIGNGTTGEGGGVLFAGVASYNNTVTDNQIVGNGLAGVTIHEHGTGQALSGDVVRGNFIGTNDITGDPGTPDQVTTGVFVERDSPAFPTVKITVVNNTIAADVYGIYDITGLSGLTAHGNVFHHVKVHVKG